MADFSNPRESMEIQTYVLGLSDGYPDWDSPVTIVVLPILGYLDDEDVYARKAYDTVGVSLGLVVLVRIVPLSWSIG